MPDNLPDTLIGRVGFGALLLALVLAPLIGGFPAGPQYSADMQLGALRSLVLVASLCLVFTPERAIDRPKTLWQSVALWGMVGWTVLSFLVQSRFLTSPVLLFASLPGMLDWVCYGVLFWLAVRFAPGKALFYLLGAVMVGAGVAAVASVQEYGQFVQGGMPDHRAQGLFFSPNFAGGLMALLLPVTVAACVAARNRLLALVLGAVGAMMAGALFATGSRASIAFTAVGLLVALGFSLPKLKAVPGAWARIGVLLVMLAALAFAFRGPLVQRVESASQEQSGPFRSYTWKGTLAMAKAHPVLGTGPGTYPYIYPHYAVVAKTDLAHSSYLQMASEQGFPALLFTVVALGLIVLMGGIKLIKAIPVKTDDPLPYLLMAGLLGGLLAGMARSLVDSEWSIFGDAFAFWTIAGLLTGVALAAKGQSTTKSAPLPRTAPLVALGLAGALVLTLLCLRGATARNSALNQVAAHQPPNVESAGWPPEPQMLVFMGKQEEATVIEPTGKRFYQLGRMKAEQGDFAGAVTALKQSVTQEPTNMQSWRRLAEIQEKAGDATGALESWRQLIALQEGPTGTIRAIPEATETHPAFAYAALARDAAKQRNISQAVTLYEKATDIVERYVRTPMLYQQMEFATAQLNGINIATRREEIRTLYQQVIEEWIALQKERSAELAARRDTTLSKLVVPDGAAQ